jgi:hypothetical protein
MENPQARREVIAQIFEYAALLRGWSYGDLLTRLAPRLKWPGANALFQHVSARCGSVDEARFVDGVARSLARGEFILLVAGDGMRADVQAIAAYLDQQMGLAARLALVEFQVWTDAAGNTTVVPWVPLRTNVLEHRIFVGPDELPISVEADQVAMSDVERVVDPAASSRRERSRAFWERFIAGMQLDHPDQPPPRHGGEGWVRLDLPPPANWLTAFRSSKRMGAFFKLRGRDSEEAANILEAEAQQQTAVMDEEAHLKLEYERTEGNTLSVGVYKDHRELGEDEQLAWLKLAVNAMITSFRLRLSSLQHELRPVQIIP